MLLVWLLAGAGWALAAGGASYRIDARLDGGSISGRTKISYTNRTGAPLTRIPVELPGGAARDRFGEWRVVAGETGPEIELAAPLAAGDTLLLAGAFEGRLRSQSGFRFARDWHPRAVPYIAGRFERGEREPAWFEVALEVSRGEVIASSGWVEAEEPLKGGGRRLRLRTEPVTSFGIVCSKDFRVVARDAGGVAVREYQLPGHGQWNRLGFAETAREVISFYRERFGDYPQRSLAILPGAARATGGSALAGNMVQIHRDFAPNHVSPGFEQWIVAHEVGHMLWGFATVLDLARHNRWLGLRLGIYSDRLFMEARTPHGDFFGRMFVDRYLDNVQTGRDNRLAGKPDNSVAHNKGFAVIQMLEQVLGPDRFLALARRLLEHRRWTHLAVADFEAEAEAVHGQPLDWFFSDWVENDRVLSAEIEAVSVADDGAAEVTVRFTGTARVPLVCEVERTDGSRSRAVVERDPARQVVRVVGAGPVRAVRLDPDRRLPLVDPRGSSRFPRP